MEMKFVISAETMEKLRTELNFHLELSMTQRAALKVTVKQNHIFGYEEQAVLGEFVDVMGYDIVKPFDQQTAEEFLTHFITFPRG
jgi:hypothetical protein